MERMKAVEAQQKDEIAQAQVDHERRRDKMLNNDLNRRRLIWRDEKAKVNAAEELATKEKEAAEAFDDAMEGVLSSDSRLTKTVEVSSND
jgi:hypothetical protein